MALPSAVAPGAAIRLVQADAVKCPAANMAAMAADMVFKFIEVFVTCDIRDYKFTQKEGFGQLYGAVRSAIYRRYLHGDVVPVIFPEAVIDTLRAIVDF